MWELGYWDAVLGCCRWDVRCDASMQNTGQGNAWPGMLSRDAEPGQELGCHMGMQGWDPQPGMPSRVTGLECRL